MPPRIIPFANGEFYHVYNRGVARLPTYTRKKDYERFILYLSYYQYNNIPYKLSRFLALSAEERQEILTYLKVKNDTRITLVSYVLMPNHFHLLLRQEVDGGISSFMRHLSDGYTRYFNTKYERVGSVYQGPFKAVRIETEEQLLHVSRYIHLNPLVSYIVQEKDFSNYPWSSFRYYLNQDSSLVNTQIILDYFPSVDEYRKFVVDQINYGKELEKIKHLVLEVS